MKNPVDLVPPGSSGTIELSGRLRAQIVRANAPGKSVWLWAPRGEKDPSMLQALGELRDWLASELETGAVGFILDDCAPQALRGISEHADVLVRFCSMPVGFEAAPHAEVDLSHLASRKVARALGAVCLTPEILVSPIDRAVLGTPAATWIDGEYERLSRTVIDRALVAAKSLLASFRMISQEPLKPQVRVALKAIVSVESTGRGLVEALVHPGDLIHAGDIVGYEGPPGRRGRRALIAPASGLVLYVRAGRPRAGSVIGIGKVRRTLPSLMRLHGERPTRSAIDLGWCEHVAMPDLGVSRLKAKIDTGARTSALHVIAMRPLGPNRLGQERVEIEIPSGRRGKTITVRVEICDVTSVRDSSGRAERRPVIETRLEIGNISRVVRVSLTYRGDMIFPMLVGRTALGAAFRVQPGRRYLLG